MSIDIRNICKSFEDKTVLENFSILLESNKVYCFLGPSGSGKTTLFNIIAEIMQPDSGTIDGLENKKIATVFQQPRLAPWLTAAENVELVCGGDSELSAYWLTKMALKEELNTLPRDLSGGMRQRVSIARALAYGGDILLLDEPFNGLDGVLKKQVWGNIRDRFAGKTILVITHHQSEAEEIADEIILMDGPPLTIRQVVNNKDNNKDKRSEN